MNFGGFLGGGGGGGGGGGRRVWRVLRRRFCDSGSERVQQRLSLEAPASALCELL